ncbi:MAG: hypothetical protein K9G46_12810 [Flavobacteriales bacterium]|jgi:hypothetical protein|nr:hypothetical protein [Flavobacteriales bacterium]
MSGLTQFAEQTQFLRWFRSGLKRKKLKLSGKLEKDEISTRLTALLKTFQTDEFSEETILEETEVVRKQVYERKKA